MVHLSITALMKALSLTIENTTQNNSLEESSLGLGLNFGASPHLGHFDLEPNKHNFPTNPMGSSGTHWARLYNNNYKNQNKN